MADEGCLVYAGVGGVEVYDIGTFGRSSDLYFWV